MPTNIPKQDVTVNEAMETLTHNSQLDRVDLSHETTNGEDMLSLFNQYSDLISPNWDWLATEESVIINEASVEVISTAYYVTV